GYRVEGAPGPTDPLPASGGESEVSALSVGTYFFPTTINETTSASSARFPCLNVRSRNRVTPSYGVRPSSQPNAIGCPRHSRTRDPPGDPGATGHRQGLPSIVHANGLLAPSRPSSGACRRNRISWISPGPSGLIGVKITREPSRRYWAPVTSTTG